MHADETHTEIPQEVLNPLPNDAARSINMLLKSTGTYYYCYYKNNKNKTKPKIHR
jgi:hypothetical protein